MSEQLPVHRFRDQIRLNPAASTVEAAFVPCPMYASMPASQQDRVQEIYRRAAELTREHFRLQRAWRPAFSLN